MTTENIIALDLFAGHGWGVACHFLGIEEHGVELMDEAVATRDAAGFSTIYRDVWDGLLDFEYATKLDARAVNVVATYNLLIASPPCQTFSAAGKGAGRKALDEVLRALDFCVYNDPKALHALTETLDPRTALVLAPLAYIFRDRPTYVALEQVPSVLPVWEAYAEHMRGMGYSVATGILNAEQYGVPQTRKRAILVASLVSEAKLPTPTHSRYYPRDPSKLDEGVLPWVSMAEALGWGMTARPYPTVASGAGSSTGAGGPDPAALGGSQARKRVYQERAEGRWEPSGDADNDGGILRLAVNDAALLQTYPWAWERPATTVAGDPRIWPPGHRINADDVRRLGDEAHKRYSDRKGTGAYRASVEEAAALQTYPRAWGFTDRPAVTVGNAVGRGLIGGSGAKETVVRAIEGGTFIPSQGDGSNYAEATRISVAEAGVLQTYPRPFPFQGSKTSQFLQVGNAVPPLLAHAILTALLRKDNA